MPDNQQTAHRREADRVLMDIEDMIIKENDPHQRAFLVVLNSINISLVANTRTVHDIGRKLEAHLDNFEKHATNEEALINKGRGAWNVLAWVLSIVQIGLVGVWTSQTADMRHLNQVMNEHMVSSKQIETRVDALENQMSKIGS